jgi:TPR repeat protein
MYDAPFEKNLDRLLRTGERYRDGEGVEKDQAKARAYLTKAAAAGSPTAQDELDRLDKGMGTKE